MDKMLMKLMEKKKSEGKVPEEFKSAKMDVLKRLRKEMMDMEAEDMKGFKGMQKVTVAAPDSEGLKMGLEKAEDVLEGKLSEDGEELCPECGMKHEGEEHAMSEDGEQELSVEEIDQKIKELEALKKSKLLG